MNRDIETDAKEIFDHQATFNYQMYKTTADVKSISIKNRTYYFFNDMSNLNDFDRQKNRTKTLISITLDTSRLKNW